MNDDTPPDAGAADGDPDARIGELVRRHASRHRASPALQARVRAGIALLAAADATADAATAAAAGTPRLQRWAGRVAGLHPARAALGGFGAGVLAVALLLWVLGPAGPWRPAVDATPELVAAHVRSLMASHLTDVAASDQHVVKPWFQGRLDFAPPVEDFAADGYPLAGGRLDYLAGRPVAALVYRRHQHVINLLVWPARDAADAPSAALRDAQGYHVVQWRDGAMRFAAVSDVNVAELQAFERLWAARAAGASRRD